MKSFPKICTAKIAERERERAKEEEDKRNSAY